MHAELADFNVKLLACLQNILVIYLMTTRTLRIIMRSPQKFRNSYQIYFDLHIV
jgi:hypothetical protein